MRAVALFIAGAVSVACAPMTPLELSKVSDHDICHYIMLNAPNANVALAERGHRQLDCTPYVTAWQARVEAERAALMHMGQALSAQPRRVTCSSTTSGSMIVGNITTGSTTSTECRER